MIRAQTKVLEDTCPTCKQRIIITNWDEMEGIQVDAYRVDPTPLTLPEQTACVVIGRPIYLLQQTTVATWRLSRLGYYNTPHPEPAHPIGIVPHHLCGARFPAEMPMPDPITTTQGFTPPF